VAKTAILLAILALAAAACGPAQPANSALGGGGTETIDGDGDGEPDDVPDGVSDIFTVEELEDLLDAGLPIYTGDEPPSAVGEYIANSLYIRYDPAGLQTSLATYYFAFRDQTDAATIVVDYESPVDDVSVGNGAFIAGESSCFSIFADVHGEMEGGECRYHRPTVYSACLDNTGSLAGFVFGFVMKEHEGECSDILPPDYLRVIEEADGVAVVH
jgi:hypothetical protein